MSPIRASGRTVTGQRAPTGHSQRAAAMSTRYADFGTSLRMKGEAIDAADQQVQSWWVDAATHTPEAGRASKQQAPSEPATVGVLRGVRPHA